jgi:hypothetical protein
MSSPTITYNHNFVLETSGGNSCVQPVVFVLDGNSFRPDQQPERWNRPPSDDDLREYSYWIATNGVLLHYKLGGVFTKRSHGQREELGN